MYDEKLRQSIIQILGLEGASQDEQDLALINIESAATRRFARAVPELLNDDQLKSIEAMSAAGATEDEIVKWVQKHVPDYDAMMDDIIREVAKEVAAS